MGQGVSQNKAHQAVMLAVLRLLRELGTPLRGQLYWTVNNEGRSSHDCTNAILERLDRRPDSPSCSATSEWLSSETGGVSMST